MKKRVLSLAGLTVALAGIVVAPSMAQDRIYRCGNQYVNDVSEADADAKKCKLISGGNVTVTKTHKAPVPAVPTQGSKQYAKSEDSKTEGLSCYDIGYRFGHTATTSFQGKNVSPAWDFAVPDRCKNDSKAEQGIHAGTRAAQ